MSTILVEVWSSFAPDGFVMGELNMICAPQQGDVLRYTLRHTTVDSLWEVLRVRHEFVKRDDGRHDQTRISVLVKRHNP